MLASKNPKSFISGVKVDLSSTLKQASSKEFHHIFPNKYLQREEKAKKEIYAPANFCFLNNADNQKIKDKAPKDYVSLMNADSISEMLDAVICPSDIFSMKYEEFLAKSSALLAEYANSLLNSEGAVVE